MRRFEFTAEQFPLREPFVIARVTQHAAEVVVVTIREGEHSGRGECEHANLVETGSPDVIAALSAVAPQVEAGLDREGLRRAMPAGPARSAIDCALWDLEAKRSGRPAWHLAGVEAPRPIVTAFTLSLGTPEKMAKAAARHRHLPLLKLKLGGEGDIERVAAVRAAAPGVRLIVDANESWTPTMLERNLPKLARLGVELIEQPLPHGADDALARVDRVVPVCADESCLDRASLPALAGRYDCVNIKLDKTGGLTEALALAREARDLGLGQMVGCMVGTSLAMAPALLVAGLAPRFTDLDGPLLLARDRTPGLTYRDGVIEPADAAVWG